jgi:hypothetical protein
LILSLCGLDDETVAWEYSLTDLGLAEMRPMILEHLLNSQALKGNRQGAENMISAKYVISLLLPASSIIKRIEDLHDIDDSIF